MNPDSPDPYYPNWLTSGFFENKYPWDASTVTTMDRFLSLYTLHDSYWIDLRVDAGETGECTLFLRFDAHWTDGRVPHPGSQVAQWPILLIRIPVVRSISLDSFSGALLYSGIAAAETVPTAGGALQTRITGIVSNEVVLVHDPEIEVLCISREGEVLPLPDLG